MKKSLLSFVALVATLSASGANIDGIEYTLNNAALTAVGQQQLMAIQATL